MNATARMVGPNGIDAFDSPAPGEYIIVRATGEETDGQYDVVEVTIPPGPGITPLHIHHDNDEAMFVIDGQVTVQLGEERHGLEAGAYAMAPRGLPHTYRNASDTTARVLFIYSPGNHWHYLKEAGARGPVEDESDIEELLPILESFGIEMVGPPLDAVGGD